MPIAGCETYQRPTKFPRAGLVLGPGLGKISALTYLGFGARKYS